MKKIFSSVLLLSATIALYAQQNPEKYAATITADDLKKHLLIVASAEMEGRETATPGQRKAAAYIQNHFQTLGLKPGNKKSYEQIFPLMEDSMVSSKLRVGKQTFEAGKDFLVAARSNDSKKIKAKRIVFAGYGIDDSLYSDYRGLDVKDAIVVIAPGEPKEADAFFISGRNRPSTWTTTRKLQTALSKGAKAVFLLTPTMPDISAQAQLVQRKTGVYFPHKDGAVPLNMANISHKIFTTIFGEAFAAPMITRLADADKLAQADYNTAKIKTRFTYKENKITKATSSNVLALIEGSDKKNEYVFLTAHYDHIGKRGDVINYGADDDGSGTVAVLEMAEAFAKAKAEGNGPRRTIVFMTVSGEEKGLWGSEYYSDNPVFPLERTTANLNTDMIGRIDPKRKTGDSTNYVYVIGDNKLSSDLKPISESINKKFVNLELDYKYNDPNDPERIYYRSDHYNFARKGVPVLFYFNGTHADYHRPTDTVDKINFKLMEKRAHLIFHTAWEIANREGMLVRDLPL